MINFKYTESPLLKLYKGKLTKKERQARQEQFEEERAELFRDNKALYKLMSTHELSCINVVSPFKLDIARGALYYLNYDVTDIIYREIAIFEGLSAKTLKEFLEQTKDENYPTLLLSMLLSKVLWGFSAGACGYSTPIIPIETLS